MTGTPETIQTVADSLKERDDYIVTLLAENSDLTTTVSDQIATIADLNAQLAALQPVPALQVGIARAGNADPAVSPKDNPREPYFGVPVMALRKYAAAGREPVGTMGKWAATDLAAGREPAYSIKEPGSFADAAAGKNDAWFRNECQKIQDSCVAAGQGKRAKLTVHHEPDEEVLTNNVADPAKVAAWVGMSVRFATIAREFDRVDYGVCLMTYHLFITGHSSLDQMVPPELATLLDWITFDGYEAYGSSLPGKPPRTRWTDYPGEFKVIGDWVKAHMPGKPWGMWEVGCWEAAILAKPTWFVDLSSALTANGGSILLYFDSDNGQIGGWTLGGQRLVEFKKLLVEARS